MMYKDLFAIYKRVDNMRAMINENVVRESLEHPFVIPVRDGADARMAGIRTFFFP